jgi:long-chain-fatty-acid--CoA ligase ACSBG
MFARVLPVGVYTTNNAEMCEFIANNSEAELVVVENRVQCEKYLSKCKNIPSLKHIVVFNERKGSDLQTSFQVSLFFTWKGKDF